MQWRKAAVLGGAALGAAAVYNAAAVRRRETYVNPLGGEEGEILWRGHRVAFSRHGQGSPVLLVHGIYAGASSFEWRHTVDALSDRHTVIAVDLLGFGCSDRPSIHYTPGLYQALLGDLIARVVREPCAVVASALSAANLIALAARDPRHIAAMALIAPTGIAPLRDAESASGPGGATAGMLLGAPIIGDSLYTRLTSPAGMRRYLESVYADDRLVTSVLVERYVRAARQPGGKHAVAALISGKLDVDVRAALRRVRQPALLLWGSLARQNPIEHSRAFRVLKPDLEWMLIPGAGDLPHDERAKEVTEALRAYLERARRWMGGPRLMMA